MKNLNPETKRVLTAVLAGLAAMAIFVGINFFYAKTITTEVPDPEAYFGVEASKEDEKMSFTLSGDVNEAVFAYINLMTEEYDLRVSDKEKKLTAYHEAGSKIMPVNRAYPVDELFAEVHMPELTIYAEGAEITIYYNENCEFVEHE